MKYIVLLILSIFAFAHPAMSQENDSLSRVSFSMAQAAFSEGQYRETVDDLKHAEIYSGGTNSRILYLKIKALNQLVNKDPSYQPALESSCAKFFEITDKNTYPKDNYQEISNIMAEKTGQKTVAPAAAPDKKTQEQIDYDKAIKAHTKEAYKEFLDQYSFDPLANDIQKKYDALVEQDPERKHHKIH